MIHLITERLIIRNPQPSDLNDWHRLMSDKKTMYYLQDIMTHSLEESRNNLEEAIKESQSLNRVKYFLAIEDKATGVFIGSTGYTVINITPIGKSVGVGYFILPEYHGKGYMTEALNELIRFAFEEDDVYRIETGCITKNRMSERVMIKCGLIKEAERKKYVWHDGQLKDRVEYRLLRDEWKLGREIQIRDFWSTLDNFVSESEIVIDRPSGSAHPRYQDFIYPLDYGYLKNTTAADGDGIDVWVGSNESSRIDAVMCIIDLVKRDSEIKILIGCTEEEKLQIYHVHNDTEFMKGILILRK